MHGEPKRVGRLSNWNKIGKHGQARADARTDQFYSDTVLPASAHTLLIGDTSSRYRGEDIRGRLVRSEGVLAPHPPGLSRLPAPGEMMVSPALRNRLAAPGSALLRERLPYRIVGTIGDAGLLGPGELSYYAGSDRLDPSVGGVVRIDHFGERQPPEGLDPFLALIVLVGCWVLLFPVAALVGVAVRFGGDQRDRRLAALRLVGADRRMSARIAAGEAMVGALVGLVFGAGFFLAGQIVIERIELFEITVFARDVRPAPWIGALIVLAVPLCALAATLVAMRAVVAEPLGVVRRSVLARRRLWWRPVPAVLGGGLLVPLIGSAGRGGRQVNEVQVSVGVLLLMLGLVTLLPWLVEAVVLRLGGGPVAWQLAVRRLQAHSGTPVRAVSGVVVAVAGVVALQMLFNAGEGAYTERTTFDPSQVQVLLTEWVPVGTGAAAPTDQRASLLPKLTAIPGVRTVDPVGTAGLSRDDGSASLTVAGCAALLRLARADGCVDGDVFVVSDPNPSRTWQPAAGQQVMIVDMRDGALNPWTIPATARSATLTPSPTGGSSGVFVTPSAAAAAGIVIIRLEYQIGLSTSDAEVLERIRTAAATVDPMIQVLQLERLAEVPRFTTIRNALSAGMVGTLLLVGASLLVGMLEQLRDRRRLLAVLAAFGTRRATMSWSVLWQNLVPLLLGLLLALPAGAGLGLLLQAMTTSPLALDWAAMGFASAVSLAAVLLITALSLPALWRLMRPAGLRTE